MSSSRIGAQSEYGMYAVVITSGSPCKKAQPLEQHDLLRLGQLEHRRDMRGDRLHLEPQHRRLQPLATGA